MPTPAPAIRPQPKPTSPRIKKLLSRALTTPESLTPDEVRELAASVVYYLLTEKAGAPDAVPPTS